MTGLEKLLGMIDAGNFLEVNDLRKPLEKFLKTARQLCLEEKYDKPTAPASLVENEYAELRGDLCKALNEGLRVDMKQRVIETLEKHPSLDLLEDITPQEPRPAANADMEEFRQDIFEALGEASVCWSSLPSGIFDSTKAKEIGDRLVAKYHPVKANDDRGLVDEIKEYLSGVRRSDGPIDIRDDIENILSRHASSKKAK